MNNATTLMLVMKQTTADQDHHPRPPFRRIEIERIDNAQRQPKYVVVELSFSFIDFI
jgi:hypothetical protein